MRRFLKTYLSLLFFFLFTVYAYGQSNLSIYQVRSKSDAGNWDEIGYIDRTGRLLFMAPSPLNSEHFPKAVRPGETEPQFNWRYPAPLLLPVKKLGVYSNEQAILLGADGKRLRTWSRNETPYPISFLGGELYKFYQFNKATNTDQFGVMHLDGRVIIPPDRENALTRLVPESNLIAINRGGKWGLFDQTGKRLTGFTLNETQSYAWEQSREGFTPFEEQGRYGFIDRLGDVKVAAQFSSVEPFYEGWAFVRDERQRAPLHYFIDTTGRRVSEMYRLSGMELALPRRSGNVVPYRDSTSSLWGFRRIDGSVLLEARYNSIGSFHHGLAVVELNQPDRAWVLVDEKGEQQKLAGFEPRGRFRYGWDDDVILVDDLQAYFDRRTGNLLFMKNDGRYHLRNLAQLERGRLNPLKVKQFTEWGDDSPARTSWPLVLFDCANLEEFKSNNPRNRIRCLPVELYGFTRLREFTYGISNLAHLPEGIERWQELTKIDLAGNQDLSRLPEGFFKLKNLREINLANTQVALNKSLIERIKKTFPNARIILDDPARTGIPPDASVLKTEDFGMANQLKKLAFEDWSKWPFHRQRNAVNDFVVAATATLPRSALQPVLDWDEANAWKWEPLHEGEVSSQALGADLLTLKALLPALIAETNRWKSVLRPVATDLVTEARNRLPALTKKAAVADRALQTRSPRSAKAVEPKPQTRLKPVKIAEAPLEAEVIPEPVRGESQPLENSSIVSEKEKTQITTYYSAEVEYNQTKLQERFGKALLTDDHSFFETCRILHVKGQKTLDFLVEKSAGKPALPVLKKELKAFLQEAVRTYTEENVYR